MHWKTFLFQGQVGQIRKADKGGGEGIGRERTALRTYDKGGYAEGANSTRLRVFLLHTSDVLGEIFHAHLLIQRQTVALRLHPRCSPTPQ